MKKCILLLICSVCLAITACSNGSDSESLSVTSPDTEKTTPPQTGEGEQEEKTDPAEENETELATPEITLSYVTEPVKNKISANGLLEAAQPPYRCNFYTYENLGSGTKVTISSSNANLEYFYTLDGTMPSTESTKYTEPFELKTECEIKVRAFSKKNNQLGDPVSLNVDAPFGTTKVDSFVAGDGVSGVYLIFEALSDKSGPDFTKQHYIIEIEDGNVSYDDGIPATGVQSFDSTTENNFSTVLGNFSLSNDCYESNGSWEGTLWTKDIYIINELKQGICTPSNEPDRWYDTKYPARFAVTVVYDEGITEPSAECTQVPSGRVYNIGEYTYCNAWTVFISEDTEKTPPEAKFYVYALQGYYMYEDKAVSLSEELVDVYFSKINEETGYWQWYTDEYSN